MIFTLDTNVLVYAMGPAQDRKCIIARELVLRGVRLGNLVVLLQTLIECSSVAIRKVGMATTEVQNAVALWREALPVEPTVYEDLPTALSMVARHRLAFWDAILWATAHRIGAQYLLTEDFQDGRTLEGVRFVNPFAAENDSLIERILPR